MYYLYVWILNILGVLRFNGPRPAINLVQESLQKRWEYLSLSDEERALDIRVLATDLANMCLEDFDEFSDADISAWRTCFTLLPPSAAQSCYEQSLRLLHIKFAHFKPDEYEKAGVSPLGA